MKDIKRIKNILFLAAKALKLTLSVRFYRYSVLLRIQPTDDKFQ